MTATTTHDRRTLLTVLLSYDEQPPLAENDAGSDFLRHLLTQPTRNVYRELALPWPSNPEKLVHDVRVSSRRLVEALTLATPALGRSRARTAIRRARALRRALGAAREAHVMLPDLRALAQRASLGDEITQGLDALRDSGGAALEDASKAYPPERLLTEGLDILHMAEIPRRTFTLRALGARHLYRRASDVRAILECVEDPNRVKEHHRLRVRFKSLRYTVEILAKPFSEVLDARHVVLQSKALQDALGVLNDAQDLLTWLSREDVADHLEPTSLKALREVVQLEQQARFEVAREAVDKVGRRLTASLQRSAGRIGQI